ncbi:DMT family transporter [Chroococcidiopsis sp.]|uniref:DMT family transporter n=1 Tax=Chroococcidiopsis sp. TaxID=3088168 RepID=UPI003F2AEE2F
MHLKLTESRLPFASVLLIAPFFLWGTAMVAMKGVLPHTTPLFMAGVRLLPAGILVLGAAMAMGRPQPKGWAAWLWISLFALIDGSLFQGFLAEGLVRTGAGLGSVMIDSQPLAVALMSSWLFGERIGLWGWLGLMFGVLGISLIGLPDDLIVNLFSGFTSDSRTGGFPNPPLPTPDALFQSGEWLMLLAALSMAVGTVAIRYVCRHADPVSATGWHMIIGGIPLFALSAGLEAGQWTDISLSGWISLSYATIFGSAIAYGLFFYFASSGNLTSLSALTFLTPVFALLFGSLILSEVLSPIQWTGVSLTLVSIYLVNQREKLEQLFQKSTAKESHLSESEKVLETAQSVPVPMKESEL